MKKIFLFLALVFIMGGCAKDDGWNDPVIPVSLVDIETVNIDNSGEFPFVTSLSIKKEAYMVGIKWVTEQTVTSDDDIFITPPIQKGEGSYYDLGGKYAKAIKCNTSFNSNIPAGQYISKFFKEIDRNYLPADIDEGFVLLVAPDPGEHSFRVEYFEGSVLKFFHDTPTINFY